MRICYRLWFLSLVFGLALCPVAYAEPPADLDGRVLSINGHVRFGGTIDFFGSQVFEYDFSGLPVAISDIGGDPTQIQLDTMLPVPDVPCNAQRDFSITLTGTYDPATGSVQVVGLRPDATIIDSGQDFFGGGTHLVLNTVIVSLDGIADDDGTGAITITGLDQLPDIGGPSTNLSVDSARALVIPRPGCANPMFNLNVSNPYGGFTWVAVP